MIRSKQRLAGVTCAPLLAIVSLSAAVLARDPPSQRVAAIVTEYRHNSHADMIVSRLLLTDMLDGTGRDSPLELASLYTDQRPANDISRLLAAARRFPIKPTIAEALTLGTGRLAVDGVLLIAEHGDYPFSDTGNHRYPKRRFWDETVAVFRESGRVVPVFLDKHLADNWDDAWHIYKTARELEIPLMAGSSVPGTWRHPAADVARGARLSQIVAFSYGTTDAYGFHALEAAQALAEQREGGETGVRRVQCLGGAAVWRALDQPVCDPELFDAALRRAPGFRDGERVRREAVPAPKLMIVEYEDGLKTFVFELNGAVGAWTAAWRDETASIVATEFWTQEARPGAHFTILLHGIESMMRDRKPTWPVERTLLTSGVLDALLQSYARGGEAIETPYLRVGYQPTWRWQEPPPPPPSRPWSEQ
jgi:hypothetical protein